MGATTADSPQKLPRCARIFVSENVNLPPLSLGHIVGMWLIEGSQRNQTARWAMVGEFESQNWVLELEHRTGLWHGAPSTGTSGAGLAGQKPLGGILGR